MKNHYPLSIFLFTPGTIQRTQLVLESLTNQTFKDFEVIVGTDGIKSQSEKAIQPYKQLLKIRHVALKDHKDFRFSKIFNKCLHSSRGKYCLILAHDTLLPPNGAEVLMKNISEFGSKFYISPIRKEIEIKYLSKDIIRNNFNKVIVSSKVMSHQNAPYYCEPDSGSIIAKKHLLKVGGHFDYIDNISTVGELKIRLREEVGITQKTINSLPIIHVAHKSRAYLGKQHSIQYALRSLAKNKVPRDYIINYFKKYPEIIANLLERAGRYKPGHKYYYLNLNEQGSLTGAQIALDYYKNKNAKA